MFTSILLISAAALVSGEQKRVLLDFASTVKTTFGWQKGQKPTSEIELDIALHINNAAHLESTLLQISDPSSSRYGAWLSHDELNAIVAPSKETLSTVHAWIASSGARVVSVADSQDWIKVRGSAEQMEALLATEFFEFSHVNAGPAKLVRALEPYSVPLSVAKHVAFVAPVHTFPPQFQSHVIAKKLAAKKRQSTDPALVPADLRARYNMSGFNDQAANTAAVAEFQSQFYTPSDLTSFFQQFVPGWIKYANKVTVQPPGSNDPSAPGVEASLDIEWIMGISPNVSTTFYASSTFDFWAGLTAWASLVASQRNPPLVISISYGDQSPASKPGASYEQRLSTEFQKLGAKGITIVFASGDTGDGCEVCLFDEPSFPATSPYVLSVGATRFIGGVKGGPEMAVNEFGSGGGFSWTFPQPSYQAAAVKAYLANNKNTLPWWFSFNANGRATPDVAALGIGFNVVNGQQNMLVGGTSASAPTVSAILVQLNAVRLKAGKPPLGFVNPWIYQTWAKDSNAFFDVTQGNNLQSCCFSGFECVPQYDPVTGVGSLNFKDLVKHL